MNKYGARKTEVDGITFASKKEAERYCELKLYAKAGLITDLHMQVRYEIVPKTDMFRASSYVADFVYRDAKTGETVVEDVKGEREGAAYQVFKLKQKLMYWRYRIEVKEV